MVSLAKASKWKVIKRRNYIAMSYELSHLQAKGYFLFTRHLPSDKSTLTKCHSSFFRSINKKNENQIKYFVQGHKTRKWVNGNSNLGQTCKFGFFLLPHSASFITKNVFGKKRIFE